MSGQRVQTPGWDRHGDRHSQAGFPEAHGVSVSQRNPPSSYRAQPVGSGRPSHSALVSPDSPFAGSQGPSGQRPPSRALSQSFPSYNHGSVSYPFAPSTNAYTTSDTSNYGDGGIEIRPGFQTGREYGRLEAELSIAKEQVIRLETENKRLREERDDTRRRLEAASIRVAEAKVKLQEQMGTSDSGMSSPQRTPEMRRTVLEHRLSKNSSSSLTPYPLSNSSSPLSPMPMSKSSSSLSAMPTTPLGSILPIHANVSQPPSPASFPKQTIRENLTSLFHGTEEWAARYAIQPMSILAPNPRVRNLKEYFWKTHKDHAVDQLLEDLSLRRFVVASHVNEKLSRFLFPTFMNGFRSQASSELKSLNSQVSRSRPGDVRGHHSLLEQRARMLGQAMMESNFNKWKQGEISQATAELSSFIRPMIPESGWEAAIIDLRTIVKTAFQVGCRMGTEHREWNIQPAQRGERWIPDTMVQRDNFIAGNPRLTESNGFAFVVRLGIAPSVIEKDFSTGALITQEVHRKVVLLMDNPNQKLMPGGFERQQLMPHFGQ